MNSTEILTSFLNRNSAEFDFSKYCTPFHLEDNFHQNPFITEHQIYVWPRKPAGSAEQLSMSFTKLIQVFGGVQRYRHPFETSDWFFFGTINIDDVVGTSILTFSDEEILKILNKNRFKHEQLVGTSRAASLFRAVRMVLYPSEEIAKLNTETVGFHHMDKITKELLSK